MLSPQRGTKDPSYPHCSPCHTVPSERDPDRWVPTSPCTPLHFLTQSTIQDEPVNNSREPELPVCSMATPHCWPPGCPAPAQPRAPRCRVPPGDTKSCSGSTWAFGSPDFTSGLGFATTPRSEHVALTPTRCHPHTQSTRGSGEPPGWDGAQTGQGHHGVPSPSSLSILLSPTHGTPPSPPRCLRRSTTHRAAQAHLLSPRALPTHQSPFTLHGAPQKPPGQAQFRGGAAPFHPRAHNSALQLGGPCPHLTAT